MSHVILVIVAAAANYHVITASDITACNNGLHRSRLTTGPKLEVDGCSVPLKLYAPYKETFTPSCNVHDICYDCGPYYGEDQAGCDKDFKKNMMSACKDRRRKDNGRKNRRRVGGSESDSERDIEDENESRIIENIFKEHLPEKLRSKMKSPDRLQAYLECIEYSMLEQWRVYTALHDEGKASMSMSRFRNKSIRRCMSLSMNGATSWTTRVSSRSFTSLSRLLSRDTTKKTKNLSKKKLTGVTCKVSAIGYYRVVRLAGSFHFKQDPRETCDMPFVRHYCLPYATLD